MQTISSQRHIDDAIVAEKIDSEDFEVMVSPAFEVNGNQYRVVLDGHHSLAAAKQVGAEPVFFEATATDHDAVALLIGAPERGGSPEAFLEAVYNECDYYDVDTEQDVSW